VKISKEWFFMNYMRELNAFRKFLLVNPLPSSAIVLWYSLMSLNNMTMWQRTFNAPNRLLRQLTGLSRQSIYNARARLVEEGLLEVEKGSFGEAPRYRMISVAERFSYEKGGVKNRRVMLDAAFDSRVDEVFDEGLDHT